MKRFWILAALCAASLASAQTTTTYTGTIKDLTGSTVTSGKITWTLNAPSGGNIPGTGAFVSTTVSCTINASGAPVSSSDGVSPCVITNNTSLTPTGTSYTLCIQPYFVTPGSCYTTFATGGSVNISTLVPTPATQPNYGVASTGTPNTWTQTQSFNAISAQTVNNVYGATTFSGTDGGSKLQAAINAACSTGARVVDARGFGPGSQTVSTEVQLGCASGNPLRVDFDQSTHWVPATTNTNLFWLMPGAVATNISVDVTGVPGWSATGVQLCCSAYLNVPSNPLVNGNNTGIFGYYFFGQGNTTGYGLVLQSVAGNSDFVEFVDFDHINGQGGKVGILLQATNANSFVNGNAFQNVKWTGAVQEFQILTSAGGSVAGNVVTNYQAEWQSGTQTLLWIGGSGSCFGNQFRNMFAWDLNSPTSSIHDVLIDAACNQNHVSGFLGSSASATNAVVDNSGNNTIEDSETGYFWGPRFLQNGHLGAPYFDALTQTTGYLLNGLKVAWGDGNSTYIQAQTASGNVTLTNPAGTHQWFMDGNGCWNSINGCVLPLATSGPHGNGAKVQLSDNTGTSGNIAKFDGNGNVTDGGGTATATGTGNLIRASAMPLSGTSGSIGGSALTAGQCASGTVTISGVTAGMPGHAAATDGTYQAGFTVQALGTGANTATVEVCAIVAGTPTAKTYNVRIIQ